MHVRVLLIKRRDRPGPSRRRCFVAYTGPEKRRLATFEVKDPAELLDLDLVTLARRRFEGVGEPVPEPLYLVCTHGKHDACCATHGAPLYRALARFGDGAVWEATHVGGDRFAGNLVCFPHGLYYGRVGPEEAERLAAGYAGGMIDLDFYRGLSCYSPPVQAAETFIRRRLGLAGLDDLRMMRRRKQGSRLHLVEFQTAPDTIHAVEVEVTSLEPRLLTCKATHPHRPRGFVLRSIT